MANLNHWLAYFETLHPKTIDLGLDRTTQVAKKLDLLSFSIPVITVAGTNGKGSCVALMEQILLAAGYKVGAYTSPHLLRYNERIRVNGTEVSDQELCTAFEQIEKIRQDITLTYFEFSTLAALIIFKKMQLDALVLEIGMGGRLDAVNIIDPTVGIISTIALDHMEYLGADREAIGREKAGIMRAQCPIVCGDFAVPDSVRNHAKALTAVLYCQNEDFSYQVNQDSWSWQYKNLQLRDLPLPKIELQNAATVLMAIECLSSRLAITRQAIEQGLMEVSVPGRFQLIPGSFERIFDVAHNPAAGSLLARQLRNLPKAKQTHAVIAMLTDKDSHGTVIELVPQIDSWHVGGLSIHRGGSSQIVADQLRACNAKNIKEYKTVPLAYQAACQQAQPGDRVVIFGSFHTVAEAMEVGL